MNIRGTTRAAPISLLNIHNYENLFNFWIAYINVSKKGSI
jgi:hypothetical protein